jgi:hypothetical protein
MRRLLRVPQVAYPDAQEFVEIEEGGKDREQVTPVQVGVLADLEARR